ncbi:MAG: hypothetical protein ACT4P5_10360 [Armatimonadota bacterium]
MPIGALLIGLSARQFGEPVTVVLGAMISLCVACLIWALAPAPTLRRTP